MSRHHRAAKHTAMTYRMRPRIAASLPALCIRCGRMVMPDDAWDVGHVVDLALGGDANDVGPEHRRCNRSAGGKLGARVLNARKGRGTVEDQRLVQW